MVEKILPLDMDGLPDIFEQKAVKEINYSPYTAEKSLRELKKLIENDAALKVLNLNDTQLNIFLTCRKFSVNKAFEHLVRWNKFRKAHPEVFYIPSYDELSVFMTDGMATHLPWRCQDGCVIVYINFSKYNAARHPVDAMKQFFTFVILQSLRKPMTQVNGFKVLIDMSVSSDILKICTPNNLQLFFYGIFAISPARFKAVHVLNCFAIGKMLWQMGKIFLPSKLKNRIEFHRTNETLLDFFDKSILPIHLGGILRDSDMTWWLKKYFAPEEKSAFDF